MSRVIVVWKDHCPKCDYVKNVFKEHPVSKGIAVKYINGVNPSGQTFIVAHNINLVPVVVFYDDEGRVHKATKHTAKGMHSEFKEHTGRPLFNSFA